jgi:hypothetical protein
MAVESKFGLINLINLRREQRQGIALAAILDPKLPLSRTVRITDDILVDEPSTVVFQARPDRMNSCSRGDCWDNDRALQLRKRQHQRVAV